MWQEHQCIRTLTCVLCLFVPIFDICDLGNTEQVHNNYAIYL